MMCALKDAEVILEMLDAFFGFGFACEDGVYFAWGSK